jgi:hypothetical protein
MSIESRAKKWVKHNGSNVLSAAHKERIPPEQIAWALQEPVNSKEVIKRMQSSRHYNKIIGQVNVRYKNLTLVYTSHHALCYLIDNRHRINIDVYRYLTGPLAIYFPEIWK